MTRPLCCRRRVRESKRRSRLRLQSNPAGLQQRLSPTTHQEHPAGDKSSWIIPARRSRLIAKPARSARRKSSWRCWAPPATPSPGDLDANASRLSGSASPNVSVLHDFPNSGYAVMWTSHNRVPSTGSIGATRITGSLPAGAPLSGRACSSLLVRHRVPWQPCPVEDTDVRDLTHWRCRVFSRCGANMVFASYPHRPHRLSSVMGLGSSSLLWTISHRQDNASVRGQREGRHTMPSDPSRTAAPS